MINNTRAKQYIERDYSIWSHQSWISNRYKLYSWIVDTFNLDWNSVSVYWFNSSAINIYYVWSIWWYNNQSASFNWTNSRFDITENNRYNFTTEWWVSAYIKTSSNWKMIFANYSQFWNWIPIAWYQFSINASWKLTFTFWTWGNYNPWVTFFTISWNTTITDNVPHYVEAIKTTTQVLLYVDWNLDWTLNTTAAIWYNTSVRTNIWCNEYNPWVIIDWFNWVISNVSIYNNWVYIKWVLNWYKEFLKITN